MITRKQYFNLFEQVARAVKSIRHTDENKVYFRNPEEIQEKNMKPETIYMIMAFPRYGFMANDNDNLFERFIGGFFLLTPVNEKENYAKQDAAVEACKAAAQEIFALLLKLRKTMVTGTGPKLKDFDPKTINGQDEGLMIANSFGVFYEFALAEPNNLAFDESKYDMDIVNSISF